MPSCCPCAPCCRFQGAGVADSFCDAPDEDAAPSTPCFDDSGCGFEWLVDDWQAWPWEIGGGSWGMSLGIVVLGDAPEAQGWFWF